MPNAIVILTLRDYLEHKQGISAHCSNYHRCHHSGRVRIETLIQHFGWDMQPVSGS